MEIIVIGAGIGGLCTALALQQMGHRVRVFEQADQLEQPPVGLGIGVNAMKVLHELKIDSKALEKGKIVNKLEIFSEQGTYLTETDFTNVCKKTGMNNVACSFYGRH